MRSAEATLHPWPGDQPATEADIRQLLEMEGLRYYRWSNEPGDVYAAHTHLYHKVLYVVQGVITFGLPEEGQQMVMHVGDRLDLPPGVVHDAVVGMEGVTCLEGHR